MRYKKRTERVLRNTRPALTKVALREATMAEPNSHRIHLVRPPQEPKPQPLDAKDIAAEVFDVIRECRVALAECEEYQSMICGELASRLNQMEVIAMRSTAQRARQ